MAALTNDVKQLIFVYDSPGLSKEQVAVIAAGASGAYLNNATEKSAVLWAGDRYQSVILADYDVIKWLHNGAPKDFVLLHSPEEMEDVVNAAKENGLKDGSDFFCVYSSESGGIVQYSEKKATKEKSILGIGFKPLSRELRAKISEVVCN